MGVYYRDVAGALLQTVPLASEILFGGIASHTGEPAIPGGFTESLRGMLSSAK